MSTYRMPAALPVPDVQELGADTTLPGLRGLKDLADCRPVIVIDSREAPLRFERLKAFAGTLYSGDYSIAGRRPASRSSASPSTTWPTAALDKRNSSRQPFE